MYDEVALREALNIKNRKPFIFVFPHAFNDSPHISSWQLFLDYYVWFTETLHLAKSATNCNWLIKPHPAAELYGEAGLVEKITHNLQADNLYIAPDNLSPASGIKCANAFYSGYGVTIEPKNQAEYFECLMITGQLTPLNNEQIENALFIYGVWNRLSRYDSHMIDQEILSHIWGYASERNLTTVHTMLLKKMHDRSLSGLGITSFVSKNCA